MNKFKNIVGLVIVLSHYFAKAEEYVVIRRNIQGERLWSQTGSLTQSNIQTLNLSNEQALKLKRSGYWVEENKKFFLPKYEKNFLTQMSKELTKYHFWNQNQLPFNMMSTVIWPLQLIKADKSHELPNGQGEGIKICMVDTGIDQYNPFIKNVIEDGFNFNNESNSKDISEESLTPHGTLISTLIAGSGVLSSGEGFIGVAPKSKIIMAKVFDKDGGSTVAKVAKALIYCGERTTVVNLSLGGYFESPMIHEILADLSKKGVTLIASAGNVGADRNESMTYPGSDPLVVGVGAIDEQMQISSFSPIDERLDMVAPGEGILLPNQSGNLGYYSGTSFSAAYVSGVEAIRQSRKAGGLKTRDLLLSKKEQGSGIVDAFLTANDTNP